jgi:hypothetical protein
VTILTLGDGIELFCDFVGILQEEPHCKLHFWSFWKPSSLAKKAQLNVLCFSKNFDKIKKVARIFATTNSQ